MEVPVVVGRYPYSFGSPEIKKEGTVAIIKVQVFFVSNGEAVPNKKVRWLRSGVLEAEKITDDSGWTELRIDRFSKDSIMVETMSCGSMIKSGELNN
jgi:hypothetical protein